MASIIDFLTKHDIRWVPINISIKDGGKVPLAPFGLVLGNGVVHFKNVSDETLKKFQSRLDECSHIAIDTRTVHQLDIDDPDMPEDIKEYLSSVPYFLSSTKKLPHFFFKSDNDVTKDKYFRNNNEKHEFLTGIWSYCPKNAVVMNADCAIPMWSILDEEPSQKYDKEYIKQFIQKNVPHHSKTQIKAIRDTGAVITNGRFCENVQREHKSNHVWFQITSTGISQRCTDPECCASGFIGKEYLFKKDDDEAHKEKSEYEILKDEFELTHFKIMNPICFVRISPHRGMQIMSKQDLKTAYENMPKINKKSFIDTWLSDNTIKTYECIDMLPPPYKVPQGVYNTWEGFDAERLTNNIGSPTRFVNHLRNLFGKENSQYVLSYLASIVQQPGKKTGVCLVCVGPQGVGKGAVFDCVMRRIIGEKYFGFTNNPENDLFSRFGELRNQKIVVYLDDFNVGSIKLNADPFKSYITGERINYEQKGKQAISLLNCSNYIMTTNKYDPVKLESDDRRYAVLECNSKVAQNKKYFDRFFKYIDDDANIRSIYEFLMDFDTTKIDLARDRPKSELLSDIKEMSREKEYTFLEEFLMGRPEDKFMMRHTDFYNSYKDWISANGYRNYEPKDKQKFGLFLKKIPGVSINRNNGNGSIYGFHKSVIMSDLERRGLLSNNTDTNVGLVGYSFITPPPVDY